MNSAEVLIKFKGDTSGADSATKKMSSTISGLAKSFTVGSLAAKGITKAISVFNSGLDGAISRSDTLNNFPKVMSNLGIGTDEATDSITTLSEELKGLPTTLDSAASSVQRLTSKNGSVEESTKIFLALNNAILAGGASSEVQASAIEQMSQAYAKGKPDMMEWRSIMSAMPAQLKQVAKAMGYVDADALGEALRSGSVSMDEFMNTMVKLNETGVDGFENFETQARNATGGIGTSITNMKTAFVRGISSIITSINTSLAPFGGLSGVLSSLGQVGQQFFTLIGQGLGMILPPLVELGQAIMPQLTQVINNLIPLFTQILEAIMPILIELLNTLIPPLLDIVNMILPLLSALLQPVLDLLQPILDLISPLIEVIFELIEPLLQILSEILPPIIELFSTIIQTILPPLTAAFQVLGNVISTAIQTAFSIIKPIFDAIKGILGGIIDFITGIFSGNWAKAWEGVKNIFSSIIEGIANIFKTPINWIINGINMFIRGLNAIRIPDWVPVVGGMGFHINELPQLKVGTNYVPEDTLAMIHEGEAVVPKKFNPYANGVNDSTIGTMNASGINPTINVYADFEMDPLGQVVSKIKTFSGGAKNDYNYGQGV